MPVIFNEPLSFLQRLIEYMEHTYLIHKASFSILLLQLHEFVYHSNTPTAKTLSCVYSSYCMRGQEEFLHVNSATFQPQEIIVSLLSLEKNKLHKVEGYILDKRICALYGKWTECLYSVDPATFDAHRKSDTKRSVKDRKGSTQVTSNNADEEPDEMPPPEAETVQVIPESELNWRISSRPDNSGKVCRIYQHLSSHSCSYDVIVL
uniref:Uncharacterized protein n=1 Tax=Cyprinus carpio TaxID=7962 RepID=A0A8C1MAK9_CYPCA